MAYIGTQPKDIRSFGKAKFDFTATQGQTSFFGLDDDGKTLGYTTGQITVYLNGILLDESDYTASGSNTVTLASAANAGDILSVVALQTDIPNSDYVPATGGTFSGAVVADSTVTVNGPVVANDGLTVDKATDGTILDLKGTTSQLIYQKYDTTNYLWNMENELLFGTYAEKDLRIGTNGGEKVRVKANGNVGIGTQDPAVKLEVSDGTVDVALGYPAGNIAYAGTLTNHPFALITNNGNRMNIGSDGQITMSGGWPFNTGTYYGTLTSDGGGNAYINLASWSWSYPSSYRKLWKVMIAVTDMSGNGLHASSVGVIWAATGYNATLNQNVTFNADGNTGGRWFTISSLAANTQYRYTFKAMPIDSYFTGWGV